MGICVNLKEVIGGDLIYLVHCVIALFVGMQGIPKEPGNIHRDNAPRDDLK